MRLITGLVTVVIAMAFAAAPAWADSEVDQGAAAVTAGEPSVTSGTPGVSADDGDATEAGSAGIAPPAEESNETETTVPAPALEAEPAPTEEAEPAPTEEAEPAPTEEAEPAPTEEGEAVPAPSSQGGAPPAQGEQAQTAPSEEPPSEEGAQSEPEPSSGPVVEQGEGEPVGEETGGGKPSAGSGDGDGAGGTTYYHRRNPDKRSGDAGRSRARAKSGTRSTQSSDRRACERGCGRGKAQRTSAAGPDASGGGSTHGGTATASSPPPRSSGGGAVGANAGGASGPPAGSSGTDGGGAQAGTLASAQGAGLDGSATTLAPSCTPLTVRLPIPDGGAGISNVRLTVNGRRFHLSETRPGSGVWQGQIGCRRARERATRVRYTLTKGGFTQPVRAKPERIHVRVDPAGTVYDRWRWLRARRAGHSEDEARSIAAIEGAEVRLQRRTRHGFVPVSNGDPFVAPHGGRQVTGGGGGYRWDVLPGRYRVVVSADGYRSRTSRAVRVPPRVGDLDVGLERRE